jgi:hypothetical protein
MGLANALPAVCSVIGSSKFSQIAQPSLLERTGPANGAGQRRVVMLAGRRYREFLIEPLLRRGIEVVIPMARLTRGRRLA